eukprot:2264879-Rhodomonas_salina.1
MAYWQRVAPHPTSVPQEMRSTIPSSVPLIAQERRRRIGLVSPGQRTADATIGALVLPPRGTSVGASVSVARSAVAPYSSVITSSVATHHSTYARTERQQPSEIKRIKPPSRYRLYCAAG